MSDFNPLDRASFNPHTHAGCDRCIIIVRLTSTSFNPHTHAGCDSSLRTVSNSFSVSIHTPTQGVTFTMTTNLQSSFVSIHTPTQGVTLWVVLPDVILEFQSTHPRRVWLSSVCMRMDLIPFQSTHPRRVWLFHSFLFSFELFVSIHTPTQGVTSSKVISRLLYNVSIHTPTQGVTECRFLLTTPQKCFNPHTHAGCDIANSYTSSLHYSFQSTHPRRVWPHYRYRFYFCHVSIHTPTQGVTKMPISVSASSRFQSTHPRRVWHITALGFIPKNGFNPHTHAGCDIF